jgi:hypothetical protein
MRGVILSQQQHDLLVGEIDAQDACEKKEHGPPGRVVRAAMDLPSGHTIIALREVNTSFIYCSVECPQRPLRECCLLFEDRDMIGNKWVLSKLGYSRWPRLKECIEATCGAELL